LDILRKHKIEEPVGEVSVVDTGHILDSITVVPRDPAKKISVENSSILTRPQRRILMKAWNSCRDDDIYRELLDKLLDPGKD
jgi:hypothetical protein